MAKTIYDTAVNAGHGGNDPGAVVKGVKEKTKTLKVAKVVDRELERHGLKNFMTRDTDETETASEIITEVNGSGAKLAVSLHLNVDASHATVDNGAGDGGEVYYWKTSTKGKKLAQCIEKRYKELGQNSRGCKTADLFFTRDTDMPAVLVEMWFMDNAEDRKIGNTDEKLEAWGIAIAKGILDYLGIKWKEPKKTRYRVQVGIYAKKENAENMKKKLKNKGFDATIIEV
jgi:N-acetylmuramoyl-L-alanine amidase